MATTGLESQLFFIYDHTVLQKEEDDLKDAILYFVPSSIESDNQCILCGQLMGMVEFFGRFLETSPSIFNLKHYKVAVRNLGRFTLALGGRKQEPDSVIQRQLKCLYEIFTFYQKDFDAVYQRCCELDLCFVKETQRIWDCYLPYIRRYGDSVASTFSAIPTLLFPRGAVSLFMKATHLLEWCGKQFGILGGCLMFKNRVVCTELPPCINSRLLILRPQQLHFPCHFRDLDFTLPDGVRILRVYLTDAELRSMLNTRPTNLRHKENIRQPDVAGRPPDRNLNSDSPYLTHSHDRRVPSTDKSMESLDADSSLEVWVHIPSTVLDKSTRMEQSIVDVTFDKAGKTSTVNEPDTLADNVEDNTTNERELVLQLKVDSDVNTPKSNAEQHQESCNCNSCHVHNKLTDLEMIESPTTDDENHRHNSTTSIISQRDNHIDGCSSQMDCLNADILLDDGIVEGRDKLFEQDVVASDNVFPTDNLVSPSVSQSSSCLSGSSDPVSGRSDTSSLIQNVKRAAAQGTAMWESIQSQHTNSDQEDSDAYEFVGSDRDVTSSKSGDMQSEASAVDEIKVLDISKSLAADVEASSEQTPIKDQQFTEQNNSKTKNINHIEPDGDKMANSDSDIPKISDIIDRHSNLSNLRSNSAQNIHTEDEPEVDKHLHSTPKVEFRKKLLFNATVSPSTDIISNMSSLQQSPEVFEEELSCNDSTSDIPPCSPEEKLTALDAYIQGNSDMLLVLFTERNCTISKSMVANMWKTVLPLLGEMDAALKQHPGLINGNKSAPDGYNFLQYDEYTRDISGKISRSGHPLQPLSQHEHDFCDTAMNMHEEFQKDSEIRDITLRSHTSSVYSHRTLSRQTYFQPKGVQINAAGLPSERDGSLPTESQVYMKLLQEQRLHIV